MERLARPRRGAACVPGLAPYRLPRLVGLGTAARLILSGESIGADEALRVGLVDYVAPADQFQARVDSIVQTYLAAPRTAVVGSKRLMRRAFDATWQQVYDTSLPLLAACLASPEVAAAREARRRDRAARPGAPNV